MFTERSEMEWKEEHDVFLCREILVSQPFKFKERTIERGKIWDEIANRLNNCQTLKFRVNKRSVRESFKLIKKKFKRKIQDEAVCNQSLETQITMLQCTIAGGRTKGANEQSFVFVHQHG